MSYKNYFKSIRDKGEDLFSSYNAFSSFKPTPVKRAELIKPYVHRLDEERLMTQINKHVTSEHEINTMYSKAFNNMRKINRPQLIKDTIEFYEDHFPKELINDMFNLHLKKSEKLTYEGRSAENQFRYKILDKILDPINRMVAESSNVKSMIMTRGMVQYFSMMMAYQKQVEPEEYEKMKNALCGKPDDDGEESEQQQQPSNGQGQGSGGGKSQQQPQNQNSDQHEDQQDQGDQDEADDSGQDGSSQQSPSNQSSKGAGKGNTTPKDMTAEEILDKLSKNSRLQALQDEITNDARQTINGLSEVIDDQEQEEMWMQADNEETQFDKDTILSLLNEFNKMSLNMNSVNGVIRKLLDKTMNYFTGKEDVVYENIFEATSISDIMDYGLLHPKLRKIFADDIMVRDVTTKGKINIYIDCSGSMGSEIMKNVDTGHRISCMDFVKSFTIKLLQMGMVNKIFPFENNVTEIKATAVRVSTLTDNGGTSLINVVKHIEKEGVNAIILTDAEDRLKQYSSLAYFIGVKGANFRNFDAEVLHQYADKAQMIEFDGEKIYHIDHSGNRM